MRYYGTRQDVAVVVDILTSNPSALQSFLFFLQQSMQSIFDWGNSLIFISSLNYSIVQQHTILRRSMKYFHCCTRISGLRRNFFTMRNTRSKTRAKYPMSHYSFQAVAMLSQCQTNVQRLLEEAPRQSRALAKLEKSLVVIDSLLLSYLHHFDESMGGSSRDGVKEKEPEHALQAMASLKKMLGDMETADAKRGSQNPQDPLHHSDDQQNSFYENPSTKTAVDTLLFRLIVSLELLLVRIDDARYVILGRRVDGGMPIAVTTTNFKVLSISLIMVGLCTGAGYFSKFNGRPRTLTREMGQWIAIVTKATGVAFASLQLMKGMARVWMRDKIVRSTNDLKEWASQWELIHQQTGFTCLSALRSSQRSFPCSKRHSSSNSKLGELLELDDKSKTLIEHAMRQGRKTYFWRSTGEIRFLMLKRFMDVYYASVGTAISTKQTSALALPLVTGAAASFYSLTGVSQEALSSVVNDSSLDLIKHAW